MSSAADIRNRIARLREQNEKTRAVLTAAFPKAFLPKGYIKKPLKIGIFQDIVNLGSEISKKRLRNALRDYTSGPLYLKALKAGTPRINLEGDEDGFVSSAHAIHAEKELAAINAKKARKSRHNQHRERVAA